ncbi:undecaprenyldiphospho-muramoylpentapeptide beta-N-acetylglucosaminyltransferase [Desulfovibrio litoralis]|uniref:UDP-N-acetylglucosamine--N-acetylmuramyl-(pentapeptide) pyrophosphoryl-undecaprenol N-acetylglucosamine transferase n=1 Tax=Desulfovibrio litoralis DSM 11393 TaxID=1121455 RepID=A0A1M7SLL9_9BACT|nr:undecaprenyldiphospho-muramoylpentapeptide beta-N-acetylglucosaminyltransferase [Desulfovibrio litoralis]SHN59371.1 UDP-N-acetylglucosamine-N-acetylmuramylpentapeptide N-acetylglucosamine transferase [Desulfovibrio litoralis DSM 11393]
MNNPQSKSIILTSGGTGGHIFPALAVAEELKKSNPDIRIVFVGGLYGPEANLVSKAGFEFIGLPVKGVLGRGLSGVKALFALFFQSLAFKKELKKINPSVIAGFGGYASIPSLLAGVFSGVPVIIHEQNSVPGLSNRLMSRLAKRVCLSLPQAKVYFNEKKCVVTGNPVRSDISGLFHIDRSNPQRRLLVLGGSQGARAINLALVKALPDLIATEVKIVHQAGASGLEETKQACLKLGLPLSELEESGKYHLTAFIDNMGSYYENSDLVLSRAGATSIAELCAAALPSVLVPFPFATHDHQTANAKALSDNNAAILLTQKELEANDFDLAKFVCVLLNNPARLAVMSDSVRLCAKPDAARILVDELLKLA